MNGKFVPLKETISGFKAILDGKYDHLPEPAFYMVGGIEEVEAKAKSMAAKGSSTSGKEEKKDDKKSGPGKLKVVPKDFNLIIDGAKPLAQKVLAKQLAKAKDEATKEKIRQKWAKWEANYEANAARVRERVAKKKIVKQEQAKKEAEKKAAEVAQQAKK